jgi:hypothetical protein
VAVNEWQEEADLRRWLDAMARALKGELSHD